MKTDANFLSKAERSELLKIARDGLEEHRVARRANAILLLDKGWSYAMVSETLLLDDSTLRLWRKAYAEGGVDNLIMFDLKGGFCALARRRLRNCASGRRRHCPARPPRSAPSSRNSSASTTDDPG